MIVDNTQNPSEVVKTIVDNTSEAFNQIKRITFGTS